MDTDSPHDNINVKVNSHITVYGNVVMLSGSSALLVGFLFLAIWMHSYWEQAVTVSAIIVYGLVVLMQKSGLLNYEQGQ